jgi:hypothetical protein
MMLHIDHRSAGWVRAFVASTAFLAAAACTPGAGAPAGAPVADPEAAAARLQMESLPDGPRQVNFEWALDEAGSRLRGRGVARLVAPERFRLDLFGPRGETYLSAAMVDGEVRLPGALPGPLALPSPSLLWAAVGVVQPPPEARLASVTATERDLVVRYTTAGGETFEYRATGEPLRLISLTRAGRTGVRESLQLNRAADGTLQSTRYRDLEAFRELVLTVESMTPVAAFPPAIWSLDGTAR